MNNELYWIQVMTRPRRLLVAQCLDGIQPRRTHRRNQPARSRQQSKAPSSTASWSPSRFAGEYPWLYRAAGKHVGLLGPNFKLPQRELTLPAVPLLSVANLHFERGQQIKRDIRGLK